MARSVRRLSLLGKFSLLSFACFVALGVVLGQVLKGQIERRALRSAEASTATAARTVASSELAPSDLRRGLSATQMLTLDEELKADRGESTVQHAKIYDRKGKVIYSDDRGEIGDQGESGHVDEGAVAALRGEVSSDVEEEEADDGMPETRLLEVYVPLRFERQTRPAGVFELYLPYGPTAAEIRRETRVTLGLLGGGLMLLFLVLFRIVAGASRTLRRQAEENRHQALHDALTELPNRTFLYSLGDELLTRSDGASLAVLLIDLDHFKEVNDTLGHDCGDDILREVSERMLREIRHDDTLARLGGDEFAVLLPGAENEQAVLAMARRVLAALERPFEVRGFAVQLEASVGVAFAPHHGRSIKELIQRADVAMYEGKRGRSGVEVYSPERDPYTPERLTLLGDLKGAIERDELVLHYQPQVDLATDRVTGAEALVRWQHPTRGLLPPGEFVPLAERTASIRALTLWVVDAALRECRRWLDDGLDLVIAVNLAGPNVSDGSLPEAVAERLRRWEVPPDRLELEISESTVVTDSPRAAEVLGQFGEMGVSLALDDFGTGHSSLGYLRRLPLERVKIDRSFVMGMTQYEDDAEIVRWTIDLARSLGLEAVAEGVETAAIQEALAALGCPAAQGFFISEPVPGDEFLEWIQRRLQATRGTAGLF
jgi:diguanylate cyclase (GGDEF)-like protein